MTFFAVDAQHIKAKNASAVGLNTADLLVVWELGTFHVAAKNYCPSHIHKNCMPQ